jgi:hypothetical protein
MKITKHPDAQGLLLANLSLNPHIWPGDILSDKGLTIYKNWKKRRESLSYTFQEEIKQLLPDFNENFIMKQNEHPYALRLFLGEHISLDTLVILNQLVKFYQTWNKTLDNDIVWKEISLIIPKYQPFLNIDSDKFKKILMERFNDQE